MNEIGRVLLSTGSWCEVLLENGIIISCRVKGKMRIKGLDTTNPVAVGDRVRIELELNADTASIIDVLPRNNYIIRRSPHHRKQSHILAANLDIALLVVTIKSPRTSFGFTDRFLVNASMYHIPVLILLNKMDLLDENEKEMARLWEDIYKPLGYQVLKISALNRADIEKVRTAIKGNTILLAGHSGTGKSTLLNSISPELKLKTANLSGYSGKGMHTTTFARMIILENETFVIDTPGIKEFDILDIEPAEVGHYFPEIQAKMDQCKFANCLHENEQLCAVKKAVEEGSIAASRYDSYISILLTRKNDYHWK